MLHDVSPVYIELGNGLAPLWQVLDWLTGELTPAHKNNATMER